MTADPGTGAGMREFLHSIADRSADFLESLEGRPVGVTASVGHISARLSRPLGEEPLPAEKAIEELARGVECGLVASSGPRFFGFVMGGATPTSLAADWLTSTWDQNAQTYASSPAAAVAEEVVAGWLLELLGLPEGSSVGLVTGCQMANFTALCVARNALLARAGWSVWERGLLGAPAVRVLLSEEAHATVRNALYMLGFGVEQCTTIPADDEGRMRLGAVAAELTRSDAPVIVSAQAGNVNSGAFEPIGALADLLVDRNAWLHVDGAFGLWAAVSPGLRPLLDGFERADSWATDAHKWLNVPFESGVVIVRRAADHRSLKTARCAYSGDASDALREGSAWVPENTRRARAFTLYAALRALGRSGVRELVERCVQLARRFAEQAALLPGATVVNEVVLNQVIVRFDVIGELDAESTHAALAAEIQSEGVCWIGATRWRGRPALRVSISNWSTDEAAIDAAVSALARARERVAQVATQ